MKHCHYLITLIQLQPFSLIAFLQKQNPSKVILRISCSIEISCSSIVRLIFTISFELKALRILLALPSSLYFEAYFWLKENRFSFTNNVTLFWKPSFSLLIFLSSYLSVSISPKFNTYLLEKGYSRKYPSRGLTTFLRVLKKEQVQTLGVN